MTYHIEWLVTRKFKRKCEGKERDRKNRMKEKYNKITNKFKINKLFLFIFYFQCKD